MNYTVGLSRKEAETINMGVGLASHIADYFVPGLGTAINSLTPILTGLFTDKPCDPQKPCRSEVGWDGSGLALPGPIECCMPPISGTTVLVCEHKLGYKKWPGWWRNLHAGDYYYTGQTLCGNVLCGGGKGPAAAYTPKKVLDTYPDYAYVLPQPEVYIAQKHPMYKYTTQGAPPGSRYPKKKLFFPIKKFGLDILGRPKVISNMIIPEGFAVQLFTEPSFEGEASPVIGPGDHNLHQYGWADKEMSMKVRGPLTIWDYWAGKLLSERTPGWITESWPKKPTMTEIAKLVLGDPTRKNVTSFDEPILGHVSFWGPGWEKRVKKVSKKMPKVQQQQLEQQGQQQMWQAGQQSQRDPILTQLQQEYSRIVRR